MTPEEKEIFCRVVGVLLVSDVELHDSELRYLDDLYERLGISKEQRTEIESKINIDDDFVTLASKLSLERRAKLLEELHNAAWADGILVSSESMIIRKIEALLED